MKFYSCENLKCSYFVEIKFLHLFLDPEIFHVHSLEIPIVAVSTQRVCVPFCVCAREPYVGMPYKINIMPKTLS